MKKFANTGYIKNEWLNMFQFAKDIKIVLAKINNTFLTRGNTKHFLLSFRTFIIIMLISSLMQTNEQSHKN